MQEPDPPQWVDTLRVTLSAATVLILPVWLMITAVMMVTADREDGELVVRIEGDQIVVDESTRPSFILAAMQAALVTLGLGVVVGVGWGGAWVVQRVRASRPDPSAQPVDLDAEITVRGRPDER